MRLSVIATCLSATCLSLCLIGFSTADDAHASAAIAGLRIRRRQPDRRGGGKSSAASLRVAQATAGPQ